MKQSKHWNKPVEVAGEVVPINLGDALPAERDFPK